MPTLHHWTPTLESKPLSRIIDKPVYLKMECFQPTGSFKIRGLGRLCQEFAEQGKTQLVSSSGGNAGYSAAYAGVKLGMTVTVFVPETTHEIFRQRIRNQGAELIVAGKVWDEANEVAHAFAEKNNAGFVHPFDHPSIWAGHASMIDEIVADGIEPDAVVVAVGGGGLLSGVLQGMHHHGWQDIPVFAIETIGAASLKASMQAGQLVTLDKIDTIATSLGARRITDQLFDWTKKRTIR